MSQTYPARRLSKASLLLGPVSVVIWGALSILFLSFDAKFARFMGVVMLVFVLGTLVSFVRWVTRKRGDLVIGTEAVAFASHKVYYKDMKSVERGASNLGKDVFQIVIRTDQARHEFNLLDYQVAPEYAGTIFDEIAESHQNATNPRPAKVNGVDPETAAIIQGAFDEFDKRQQEKRG